MQRGGRGGQEGGCRSVCVCMRVWGGDASLEEAQSAVCTQLVAEEARLSMLSGAARQIDWAKVGSVAGAVTG